MFNTLLDFKNYIPNCIICGKPLNLYINCVNYPQNTHDPSTLYLQMIYENNIFRPKKSNHNLIIDGYSNQILDGVGLLDQTQRGGGFVRKTCRTCYFHIYTRMIYDCSNMERILYFPALQSTSETMGFTLKGAKSISIYNSFGSDFTSSFISINDKRIKSPIFIDFSKINDLKQLNKKIKMILTFQ